MSVLDAIISQRRKDVDLLRGQVSLTDLMGSEHYRAATRSLSLALRQNLPVRVIAEHKRASPSTGDYGCQQMLKEVVAGYDAAGAVALSILTEPHRFGGSLSHLSEARRLTNLPFLRKDFIVDTYQIHEAKSAGADAVLLIAAGLEKANAKDLADLAHDLGLEVLLEIHDAEELDFLEIGPDIIGINNRDLKTLRIDLETSHKLCLQLPDDVTRISESGVHHPAQAAAMMELGFDGLLIGTKFMQQPEPGKALRSFLAESAIIRLQNDRRL
jgi:indole-3-glycerol phosphate synthase